jgi:two-component system sensor histidine kinase KdpD
LESTEPIDVVNAAVERKRPRLAVHRIELDLARDLPFVEIDPILIEQALGQILENAAKYSPSGSTVRITARSERDQVVISVHDQGAGLTAQEQNQLWTRFFRGERHVSTVTGSGVGLWIAQAFVTANGGTLRAASQGEGRGTTIAMYLPAAREDPHAAAGE